MPKSGYCELFNKHAANLIPFEKIFPPTLGWAKQDLWGLGAVNVL